MLKLLNYRFFFSFIFSINFLNISSAQISRFTVSNEVLQRIYNKVVTPFKYGLVMVPDNDSEMFDCPTIFRMKNKWYMTFVVFNGKGYETWIAKSNDLLHWMRLGRVLSFTDTIDWDCNQKAGYPALIDYIWGHSYHIAKFNNKYWMSYFGGRGIGYEKGTLSIGIAFTNNKPTKAMQWNRLRSPVLTPHDKSVNWWDNHNLYKSTIIWDKKNTLGHPFVMFYNANGDSINKKQGVERIGIAVSDDMLHWVRFSKDPVLDHHMGITGDPYIQKIDSVWVMFYYGAFWINTNGAFNRFACSYDLIHWTDWDGPNLIQPSTDYDEVYAHKPCVIQYKGIVYHFYCAVNKKHQRGIALATSVDIGKSNLNFY